MGFTKRQKGFGLTEGLIGLAVLSTGLLAIYGVHTSYIKSFSDEREKAEMMSKLSSEMTKAKSFSSCESLSNYAATLTDISMSVSEHNEDETACDIAVSGAWSSPISSGTVAVSGVVFLRNLSLSSSDSFGESDGGAGSSNISPPTGDAEYVYGDDRNRSGVNLYTSPGSENEQVSVIKDSEGDYYLIEGDGDSGEALLKSSNYFHRITGRIFFRDAFLSSDNDKDRVLIGAPDTSICRTYSTTDTATENGLFHYRNYECFVGGGWYGSLGPTETDNDGNGNNEFILLDEDVCVGNPNVINTLSNYSEHAQPSLTRRFTNLVYTTSGAEVTGVSGSGATNVDLYIETGMPRRGCELDDYGMCTWSGHDFVITDGPSGNTTATENCETHLSGISSALSSNSGKYYAVGGVIGGRDSGIVKSLEPANYALPYLVTIPSGSLTVSHNYKDGNNLDIVANSVISSVSASSPTSDQSYVSCNAEGLYGACGEMVAFPYELDAETATNTTFWVESVKSKTNTDACVSSTDSSESDQSASGAETTKYGVVFALNDTSDTAVISYEGSGCGG